MSSTVFYVERVTVLGNLQVDIALTDSILY